MKRIKCGSVELVAGDFIYLNMKDLFGEAYIASPEGEIKGRVVVEKIDRMTNTITYSQCESPS